MLQRGGDDFEPRAETGGFERTIESRVSILLLLLRIGDTLSVMSPDVKGDRLHDLFLPGCFSIFAERSGLQHNMTTSLYFSSPMLEVSEGTRCSDTVKLKSLVPSSCVVMFGPLHAATALVRVAAHEL